MHVLPPTTPVRLIKWMKNRAEHIGVETAELMGHYQLIGETARAKHFDVPDQRLDIQKIEQYLALQKSQQANPWDEENQWGSHGETLLVWDDQQGEPAAMVCSQ